MWSLPAILVWIDVRLEHIALWMTQWILFFSPLPWIYLIIDRQALSSTLHMKVTKMLLFVSTVFVFLNFPSYVLRLMLFIKVSSPSYAPSLQITQFCMWERDSDFLCLRYSTGQNWGSDFLYDRPMCGSTVFCHKFRHQFHSVLHEWAEFPVSISLFIRKLIIASPQMRRKLSPRQSDGDSWQNVRLFL